MTSGLLSYIAALFCEHGVYHLHLYVALSAVLLVKM